MRNTMHKKDLKAKDGFPKDIDRKKIVVVAVIENSESVILYYDKKNNLQDKIMKMLHPKYAEGIYVL